MITIVGGTYHERCLEPHFDEVVGSGLRACKVMLSLENDMDVSFHTFLEKSLASFLSSYAEVYPNFKPYYVSIERNILFHYEYPLSYPHIFPRLDTVIKTDNVLEVDGENILVYGTIEGTSKVSGNMVVYDPQSPVNPKSFRQSGSTARKLTIVLNWGEARILANSDDIEAIKLHFFEKENADIIVLKRGAKGADVYNKQGMAVNIPVYKTNNVWNIGSGDVFVATYSYHWFKGDSEFDAAKKASYATAEYCNSNHYEFGTFEANKEIVPLVIKSEPKTQVYLAGPFFTFAQRWLIDRIRRDLRDMGLRVFSPLHDVGYGIASEVAQKDLDAINSSSAVFAILDGLDPGTFIEVGYAGSKGIPIIGFVQNEHEDKLLMLKGCDCELVNDLTTAIYKTYWRLAENG